MIAPPPTPPAAKISKCSGIEMLTAIHAAQINKRISIQLPDFTRQFYRPSLPLCTLPQFAAIKILPMHITRVDYIHQPIAYCHTTILLPLSPPPPFAPSSNLPQLRSYLCALRGSITFISQ